jgi:hypothetical protein
VSTTRTASCLFCRRTLPFEFFMGASRMDCPTCGSYAVTIGASSRIRSNPQMRASVLAEIRRQLDSGVARPRINLDDIRALKAR